MKTRGYFPRGFRKRRIQVAFGTAINRFRCQAVIDHPVTPYGKGRQRRGFLPLRDSMQCLTLALENPPRKGEYRVFNQFEEVYDITELALKVQRVGGNLGLDVQVRNVENPRAEMEGRYYKADHQRLIDLGYKPAHDVESEVAIMLRDLMKYRNRIEAKRGVLMPDVRWDGRREKVRFLPALAPPGEVRAPEFAPAAASDEQRPLTRPVQAGA